MSKSIIIDFTDAEIAAISDLVEMAPRYFRADVGQNWHDYGYHVTHFLAPGDVVLDKHGKVVRDPIIMGAAPWHDTDGNSVMRYVVAASERGSVRLARKFAKTALSFLENPTELSRVRETYRHTAKQRNHDAGKGFSLDAVQDAAALDAADASLRSRIEAMTSLIATLDSVIGRKKAIGYDGEPEPSHDYDVIEVPERGITL